MIQDAAALAPQRQRHDSATIDARPLMARAATQFEARLLAEPGVDSLLVPDVGADLCDLQWNNTLLVSQVFRRAHVETFVVTERLSVLHVCVFPHVTDPAPIFGFDMIAGPARVTGIFLDLSPVTTPPQPPSLRQAVGDNALNSFSVPRTLPEWGDIFSPDVLAIRPTDLSEVERAIELGLAALEAMLNACGRHTFAPAPIAAGQARYAVGQRRNDHTWRMLASFIGAAPARHFIDEVLFPLPTL